METENVVSFPGAGKRLLIRPRAPVQPPGPYTLALSYYRHCFTTVKQRCMEVLEQRRRNPEYPVEEAYTSAGIFFDQTPLFLRAWNAAGKEPEAWPRIIRVNGLAVQLQSTLERMRHDTEQYLSHSAEVVRLLGLMGKELEAILEQPLLAKPAQ